MGVNHAQAVPSGGRSFLIETVTVLVCMPWPWKVCIWTGEVDL